VTRFANLPSAGKRAIYGNQSGQGACTMRGIDATFRHQKRLVSWRTNSDLARHNVCFAGRNFLFEGIGHLKPIFQQVLEPVA